ncbi:ASCH domain-containing protein [Burkholderia vietnamiensis]|uniref:hypothetical protein n=1 Tax=Burkholderia vietnamiensis TaxID=60552 RepID=UPI001D1376E8|nr:hypothetical protein [Burkholderia vietnamiensis]UEC03927.1 hypothetical protein LK462_32080 [Burkholderia vietnamiensis]
MKERPILFSGPMVRAILEGRKTQTRRVMKHQAPDDVAPITIARYPPTIVDRHGDQAPGPEIFGAFSDDGEWGCKSPFGEPGDRLWVREAFMPAPFEAAPERPHATRWNIAYAAGGQLEVTAPPGYNPTLYNYERWTPSIHMPRWASRITLEITAVRAERLQDISEQDARAEGIDKTAAGFWSTYGQSNVDGTYSPRLSFQFLWDSINAVGGHGWEANPWVWVVEFRRIES